MPKKRTPKNTKPVKNTDTVCQNCQYHKNKPSTCLVFKDEPRYTSRKGNCEYFHW